VRKTKLVLHRLWQFVPVLLAISLITFLLAQAIPGDPIRVVVGDRAPQSVIDAVRSDYGLDRPLIVQYVLYLRNLVQGDWGPSIVYDVPVLDLIGRRLVPTLYLVLGGVAMTALIGFGLATVAARRQGRLVDHLLRFASTFGLAVPVFWFALVLVLVFAIRLRWLPATGFGEGFAAHVRHMVLPWTTVVVVMVPILLRNLRASLIDRSDADFVVAERSKGLLERTIFYRHVVPNAILPNLHLMGVIAVYILGISVVVEPIFAIPGVGDMYLASIIGRDYFLIVGLTLMFAILTTITTLVVDVLSLVVDPRIQR
jgi:peptide/nickel transport system permease protein